MCIRDRYIDDLVRDWKQSAPLGIQISRHEFLNTMLFADDQFVIQDSEDILQLAIHKLNLFSKGYNLNISIEIKIRPWHS